MTDEIIEEPFNPDKYFIKSWTTEIDGKRGKATWKCWTDAKTGKEYEKLIHFKEDK